MHVLACGYRLWGFGVKFRIDMSFREYFPLGSWIGRVVTGQNARRVYLSFIVQPQAMIITSR